MNKLSNIIYGYFLQHLGEMPLDKQFHFASRLYTWSEDETCRELLQKLKPDIMPTSNVQADLAAIHSGQTIPLLPGNQSLVHLRKPYNDRYPQLRSTARLLYWAVMLEKAYDLDAHAAVSSLVSDSSMKNLYDALLEDDAAVAILSTHAVNFLYLYKRYCLDQPGPDPQHFGRIAANPDLYDFSNALHIKLRVYLLTHTIIADSLFYAEPLPPAHTDAHLKLIQQIESLLSSNLKDASLDTKLEFLVCCRITDYASQLETAIEGEASRSLSSSGNFLVDTENSHNAMQYTSLEKSEHRNTLYILSHTDRQT